MSELTPQQCAERIVAGQGLMLTVHERKVGRRWLARSQARRAHLLTEINRAAERVERAQRIGGTT